MSETLYGSRKNTTLNAAPRSGHTRTGGPVLVDRRPATAQLAAARAAQPNRTGLPDALKAGVESLSGLSLDHVQVHYNSARPAQLNAHAYAQGANIHLASGQEQHLPHETWHVVQQQQGRVRATAQRGGVAINSDSGLEREADAMGAKAASAPSTSPAVQMQSVPTGRPVIQRVWGLVEGDYVVVKQHGQVWHGAIDKVNDGGSHYDVRVGGTDMVQTVAQEYVHVHETAAAMPPYGPLIALPNAKLINDVKVCNDINLRKVRSGYTLVGHHGTRLDYALEILKEIRFFDHAKTPKAPKSSSVRNAHGPGFYVDTSKDEHGKPVIGTKATEFADQAAFGAARTAGDYAWGKHGLEAGKYDAKERGRWKEMVERVKKKDLGQGLQRAVVLEIWMEENHKVGFLEEDGERIYQEGGVPSLVATMAPTYLPTEEAQLAAAATPLGKK